MSLKQKMQVNFFADFRNNMSYFLRAQNFVMIEEKTMKLEGGGGGGVCEGRGTPCFDVFKRAYIHNFLTGRLLVVYFADSLNFS